MNNLGRQSGIDTKNPITERMRDIDFHEPPFDPLLEIRALRDGRLTPEGARSNLESALKEIELMGEGITVYFEIRDDGRLWPVGGKEPLFEMMSPDRQINELDRSRAYFDQKGAISLEKGLNGYFSEYEETNGKAKGFNWIMCSPSIKAQGGALSFELGEMVGEGLDAKLKSRRVFLPLSQFGNRSEYEVIQEVLQTISFDGRFQKINSFKDVLGEIITLNAGLSPFALIDSQLQRVLRRSPIYGIDGEILSIQEQNDKFKVILNSIPDEIAAYLCFNAQFVNYSDRELENMRPVIVAERNKFLTFFRKLNKQPIPINGEKKVKVFAITQYDIIQAHASKSAVLSGNFGGYCAGTSSRNQNSADRRPHIMYIEGRLVLVPAEGPDSIFYCISCHRPVNYPNLKCTCGVVNPDLCHIANTA